MTTWIVKTDAMFELALGLVLIVGAAGGILDGADYPSPVERWLLAAFGAALLPVGAFLWRLARSERITSRMLRLLGLANAGTAVVAIAWLIVASGFSSLGTVVTAFVAAVLACLAVAQLRQAQRLTQLRAAHGS